MSYLLTRLYLPKAIVINITIQLLLWSGLPVLAQGQQFREKQTLILQQKIERELKGAEMHSYNIALKAGQYIHIVVEQRGIDVIVRLFTPEDKKLVEVDSPNGTQG